MMPNNASAAAGIPLVFDRDLIRRNRERCARFLKDHSFLCDWAMDQVADRLSLVRKTFPVALQLGARSKKLDIPGVETLFTADLAAPLSPDVVMDEEFLPFADASLDLVVSAMGLHSVNDLPGALIQVRRALKPDGLFLAALPGGETLRELRACLTEAELEITGGMSPRVAPFADLVQMSSLMQRGGFALPVVDSEKVTVTYAGMGGLLRDLRGMGEGNAVFARARGPASRRLFARAGEIYAQKYADADGRLEATFEFIFLLGWAPHASQQQPLRPGSAKHSLAEALGTSEHGAGDKACP